MYDPYGNFEKTVLPNGLTIYAQYADRPFQEFGVVVHSGAREDPAGKDGLAHFTEHCVSRNVQGYSYEDIKKFFETMGAACMLGGTGYHFTDYSFSCELQKDSFSKALEIFGKMLINCNLTKEIDNQREVITREYIKQFPCESLFELHLLCNNKAYPGHRLENFVWPLGMMSSLRSISQSDLQFFYDRHYLPQNISIVTLGGLSIDEAVKRIENSPFGAKKAGSRNPMQIARSIPLAPACNRFDVSMQFVFGKEHKVNTGKLGSYFSYPGTLKDEAVNIANNILYKQLHNEIREKRQWCYSLDVESQYLHDIYKINFTVNIPPDKLSEIEIVIEDCIASFSDDKKLFEREKNHQIHKLYFLDLDLESLRRKTMDKLIGFNQIKSIRETRAELQAVTFKDVQDVFNYMNAENRLTILVYP